MEGTRTPEECEIMWNNFLNFNINKEIFSEEEDIKLADLAEDYHERNWDVIANALKTNRTAIQCFERYQTRLSSSLKKKYWTKEEDDRLIELIEEHKCGEIIPWNKISLMMEGRTRQQVINRYERSISQVYNRAPWAPEEDGLLVGLYQKYGPRWNKMRGFFSRRSTYAIRERYCNALTPNIRVGPWSVAEDKLLISMIRKYGYGRWAKICRKLPGRTDNMCLIRAGRLLEWSVKYHSQRGTGEYDPGVYDPEMFARILRPCAPSKYCPIRNERLRSYRENGLKMLFEALEMVVPDYAQEIDDVNSIDVSWMGSELFHRVSNILHANLAERKLERQNPIQPLKYISRPPLLRKRGQSESEEDVYYRPPDVVIPREEKNLVDSALHIMFEMHGDIMTPKLRKTTAFGLRQCAEMSLYKAYLYKQFHCKALCDTDDDLGNVVFSKVDYRETVQTVVSYFLQAPIYDRQFIVLAPNLTTLTGMEAIQATEDRLLSMSELVGHSKPYIDLLCERRKSRPQCLRCRIKTGEKISRATPESVLSDMKKKSFLLDERMKISAYIEGGSVEKLSDTCVCEDLAESKKAVKLLRKRFMALFMWPAFLSTIEFSKEQEHIICAERGKDNNYFLNLSNCPVDKQGFKENRLKRKRKVKTKEQFTKKLKSSSGRKRKSKEALSEQPCRPETPPSVLRRSSRSCVLNRECFSIKKRKSRKSNLKTNDPLSELDMVLDDIPIPSSFYDGNSSSQLAEENICDTSFIPDKLPQNVPSLLSKKNEDCALSLQDKEENSVNDTLEKPDESSEDLLVLHEDHVRNVLSGHKNGVSGLPADNRDNVLVLQEENSDSVLILPQINGNNSSAIQNKKKQKKKKENVIGMSALLDKSRDSVLVFKESNVSQAFVDTDRSSDSVVALEDRVNQPATPEEFTISSDSSVSCDQYKKSESGMQKTVAVLELKENNMCFS